MKRILLIAVLAVLTLTGCGVGGDETNPNTGQIRGRIVSIRTPADTTAPIIVNVISGRMDYEHQIRFPQTLWFRGQAEAFLKTGEEVVIHVQYSRASYRASGISFEIL